MLISSYPSTIWMSLASLSLQFAYTLWWSVSIAGVSLKWSHSNSLSVISIYFVFSFYWTSQVIKNTLHVTISGLFASFYFLEGTSAMPPNPTLAAAKRAFTTSFGPIAFGSLIVAILKTIVAIVRSHSGRDDFAGAILACILQCIESMIEYFNEYAFIQVAIYGKSFVQAAKDAWNLLRRSGMSVIVNDILVSNVLGVGCFMVALVTMSLTLLWTIVSFQLVQNIWDSVAPYAILVIIASFIIGLALTLVDCPIIGLFMMSIVTQVLESGTQTTMVCLAEDPAALARTKPELYQSVRAAYPATNLWL